MGRQYGITIKVQRFDYAPRSTRSGAATSARHDDMEALDMPAAAGVPTTVVIVGDYSNGNDALLVRGGLQLKDRRQEAALVQKTVSDTA
jgi:NitT/TauT family transport system substrate-binding protein